MAVHRFKAFPLGGKVDCRSESGGKTDEGSGYDGSCSIEQPLTTACGGASPKGEALISRYATGAQGEALIGHRRHFERSREIPYNRNGTTRTRAGPLARGGSPPRNPPGRNGATRTRASPLARGGSPPRNLPRKKRHDTHTRRPTCPRWLTAEKSPTIETARHAHAPARLPAGVLCRPPLSNFRASFQIPATSVLRDLRKRRSRSVRTLSPRTNRSERSIIRIFWRARKTVRRRRRERQP